MRVSTIFSVIVALIICGCSATSNNVPSPTNSVTHVTATIGTSTPTLNLMKTSTKVDLMTSTPMPTRKIEATSTLIPQSLLGNNCWNVHETFPKGSFTDFKQALLLKKAESPYLLDFQDGKETVFPNDGEKLIDIRVSPDGKWLAGHSLHSKMVYVVKSTGDTYTKIPYQAGWGGISQWINDSTILIQEDDNYPLNTLFAVNPFTQEIKELPHLFPDINFIRVNPWGSSGLTIYDPKLQLVVYPELSTDGSAIVLWDLDKNAPVLRLKGPELDPNPMPMWSQDGEKFVFTGLFDHPLTLVDRDGGIKHSTINLRDGYIAIIDLMSWSPDGRYLAFWLEPRKGPFDLQLLVWDTEMDRVIDTCIPSSDMISPDFGYDNLPVWSQDGKYLAVKTVSAVSSKQKTINEWEVLVVDFENELAVKVADNAAPIGWVVW